METGMDRAFMALPDGLQTWLQEQGWSVLAAEPIAGVFAGTLYRLHVRTRIGDDMDVVYKQFAPDRAQEFDLYDRWLSRLPQRAPALLGKIEREGEHGIVTVDAGVPLKVAYKAANPPGRRELLAHAARWLADMHVQLERISHEWLAEGIIETYPLASAQAWGAEAVAALSRLVAENAVDIDVAVVQEIHTMAEWFHPRLPAWMAGRMTLTHGDPHMDNLLVDRGQFRLVDWEYACVTVPQRDLAILLQDVLDDDLHHMARRTYEDVLRAAGWTVDASQFQQTFQACLFDNTLMMLAWDCYRFEVGYVTADVLASVLATKLRWLRDSFKKLSW